MNKTLIFLIISCSILVLSAIIICIAPIINNIEVKISTTHIWKPANWRNLNCAIFADKEKSENLELDQLQKIIKNKNLCYRQKAMYGLEYSAFIINVILSFVCADLTLLHFLNIGKNFEKTTGLIGLISGIIGFVLTLVYVCYSGYIFNNDIAYGILDTSSLTLNKPPYFYKLYSNGARYKYNGQKYIKVNDNDKRENGQYLLYKDLGQKQYNYDSEYYDTYSKNKIINNNNIEDCNINNVFNDINTINTQPRSKNGEVCQYLYNTPTTSVENRYIYDRWLTSLILAVIIVVINLGLAMFGVLLFKSKEEPSPLSEQTPIIYKK